LSDSLAACWDISWAVLAGIARRRAEVTSEASDSDVHLIGHATSCWVTIVSWVSLETDESGFEGSSDSGRGSKGSESELEERGRGWKGGKGGKLVLNTRAVEIKKIIWMIFSWLKHCKLGVNSFI
jgi:hypothetical protein